MHQDGPRGLVPYAQRIMLLFNAPLRFLVLSLFGACLHPRAGSTPQIFAGTASDENNMVLDDRSSMPQGAIIRLSRQSYPAPWNVKGQALPTHSNWA